jgi:hypothetical protein
METLEKVFNSSKRARVVTEQPHSHTEQPRSTAAARMSLTRARRRDGMRVVPLEIRDAEIDALVQLGVLQASDRDDRHAVARALGELLDKVPIGSWQERMQCAAE